MSFRSTFVKNWLRSKRLYEVLWFEKLILFVRQQALLPSEFSILEKKSETKKWSSVRIQRERWWKYCLQVLPPFENGNPRASHLKCIPLVKNWLRSKRLYEVLWFEKLILFVRLRSLLPSEFSILEKKSDKKMK